MSCVVLVGTRSGTRWPGSLPWQGIASCAVSWIKRIRVGTPLSWVGMRRDSLPTPSVIIVRGVADGRFYFEAKWRGDTGGQIKRRLGPAWLQDDGNHGWRKRRGRPADGYLNEHMAHQLAAEMVERVTRERSAAAEEAAKHDRVQFRRLAAEWLAWKRDVKGAAESTLRDNASMLAEPGAPHRRGRGTCKGRIMRSFGDACPEDIRMADVSAFLRELDREIEPRNVNKHRALLHAIFVYGARADTYSLPTNPVSDTDQRYEPPAEALDHYEAEEVEALARACEQGRQRSPRHYRGVPVTESPDELAAQAAENEQDATFVRVLFYSGMRLGEALAMRWRHVIVLPDLSGAVLDVRRSVSAGVEKEPKGRKPRKVPVPRPAAEALARLSQRQDFRSPDDYVFCSRTGTRLDGSAFRKRYKRAAAVVGLRPVKLHGLRHAAGSVLARSLPLISVRDALGHAKLQTTNRYLHTKVDVGPRRSKSSPRTSPTASTHPPSLARRDSAPAARSRPAEAHGPATPPRSPTSGSAAQQTRPHHAARSPARPPPPTPRQQTTSTPASRSRSRPATPAGTAAARPTPARSSPTRTGSQTQRHATRRGPAGRPRRTSPPRGPRAASPCTPAHGTAATCTTSSAFGAVRPTASASSSRPARRTPTSFTTPTSAHD